MHPRAERTSAAEVSIVSTNPETLDGLQAYLNAAGVAARCTREIDDCSRLASANTRAFVVFPDDFSRERVVAAIAELTSKRPSALPVLITAHPNRFAELLDADKVLVVARPVWGWTILDAIRAHLEAVPA